MSRVLIMYYVRIGVIRPRTNSYFFGEMRACGSCKLWGKKKDAWILCLKVSAETYRSFALSVSNQGHVCTDAVVPSEG